MNRMEADIFEHIFLSRGIFERIDPDMDAMEVLKTYEDLSLPDALDKLTDNIIYNLEHRGHGSENKKSIC